MDLFILGEKSGNPNDWGIWSHKAFVIASSLDEALKMVEFTTFGAKVAMENQEILCEVHPESRF